MISRATLEKAIAAMDYAYECILALPPGTPGKIQAATEIRHEANRLIFEFAHSGRKNERATISLAA